MGRVGGCLGWRNLAVIGDSRKNCVYPIIKKKKQEAYYYTNSLLLLCIFKHNTDVLRSYMFGSDICGKLFTKNSFKASKNLLRTIESSSFIILHADVMKLFVNQKPIHWFLKLKVTYVTLNNIM